LAFADPRARHDDYAWVMQSAFLEVGSPPPRRHDPGRCADRTSPDALPLFRAATAYMAATPGNYPIRDPVAVVLASGEPFTEPDGYSIATAVEEVLVDAGLLADERLVESERHEIRPEMRAGYSVSMETLAL
jgi:hypothetical protein